MHKVRQFKVDAKTFVRFLNRYWLSRVSPETIPFGIELGADTRLELVILGYEPNVIPFH